MNKEPEFLTSAITEWSRRCPGKTAIKSEPPLVSFSYLELEKFSNRIANFLYGKITEVPHVALLLDRSPVLIASVIGVLKCGLVFIPIDPSLPARRIKTMIEETRAEWVITDGKYYEIFRDILMGKGQGNGSTGTGSAGLKTLLIDAGAHEVEPGLHRFYLEADMNSDELTFAPVFNKNCYILFTSGSTGVPKGVLGRHRSLLHFLQWEIKELGVDEHFNVAQLTIPSFDPFLRDVFIPLMAGGTCCIPPQDTSMNIRQLIRWIDDNEITLIHMVPSLFKQMVSEIESGDCFYRLKYILLAGELLRGRDIAPFIRLFKQRIQLINGYGSTETTQFKCYYRIQPGDENRTIMPVGKPMAGAQILILDGLMQKCAVGKRGEIYIRTPFRSAGYYNDPGLTERVFLENPYGRHANDLLYKSGDLGIELPDGSIEVSGRIDHQVKIRGFRIEVGEIENRLLAHPGIGDAVVTAAGNESDEKYLCAYVVSTPGAHTSSADLRKYLSNELPDYMIPSYFVQLERLPLTHTGKIDRRALPEPVPEVEADYIAPTDETERKLVKIWSAVLRWDEDKIGIDANFFQLGGHSLKVAALASKIHKEFNVNVPLAEFFKIATIRELSRYIQGGEKERHLAIGSCEKKWFYPLSSVQKRLYFLQMMEKTGTAYNMPRVMKLAGRVDPGKLENTFNRLIQRHESFRTSFLVIEEEPVQRIHDRVSFKLDKSFCGAFFKKRPLGEPPEAFIKPFIRPFDLSRAPLLRVGLVEISDEESLLMVDMHHIISDGISMGVLVKDFMGLYGGGALPHLCLHYKDYAEWETKGQAEIMRQEDYWLREFEDDIPVLDLPLDYLRPTVKGFEGNALHFDLDSNDTRALKIFALQQGATLYMVLLAAYSVFLSKISSQEAVVVGTPSAGRRHADLEQVIGMFINTLALKNAPAGEKRFHLFLEEIKQKAINAFANQDYQYEELVEKVIASRDASRNPLFDTMFVLQNMDIPTIENPGLKLEPYAYERSISKFDLTLVCIEIDDYLSFILEYNTGLFKQETILGFTRCFRKVISAVLENPGQKISGIEIIPAAEKEQVLYHFNDTGVEYPGDKTIHRLFEEQVERRPGNIAVVSTDAGTVHRFIAPGSRKHTIHVSYRELNNRATHIAALLRAKDVKQGTIIGIMVTPSVEMIVGIFGVLKAGCAFLPIEPESPIDRINFVLNDSRMNVLLTQAHLPKTFNANVEIVNIDETALYASQFENSGDVGTPVDPVYLIYTSGTSGRPKGVLITHKNMANYSHWFVQAIRLTTVDKGILTSSFAFDALYTPLFSSLLTGCQLHVIPRETFLFAGRLLSYLRKHEVTYMKVTPSLFNLVVNSPEFSSEFLQKLRFLMLGGEEINVNDVEKVHTFYPPMSIMNHYGPTETTVGCITRFLDFAKFAEYKIAPTIGKPLYNTRAYILDNGFNLVPIGVVGGLFIGGDGVGMGYVNKPELTSAKFITGLLGRDDAVYSTGDLARWCSDGNIEFLGRADGQVKIRGYRVEPGEIESRLLDYDDLKEAVVMPRETKNGEKYLCAYFVSKNKKEIDVPGLREFLSRGLPLPMMPSYFIQLEKMPLARHNKLNRRALPEPAIESSPGYQAPGNEVEEGLVELWSEVLGLGKEVIGAGSNFFQLGGHSLKAVVLISKIHKKFNAKVPLVEVFKRMTIRELSRYIQGAEKERHLKIESREKKWYYPLSSVQKRLYFLQMMKKTGTAYNMPRLMKLAGKVDPGKLENIFCKLIQRHESFRTSFLVVEEEPVQVIKENYKLKIKNEKLKMEAVPSGLISNAFGEEKKETDHRPSLTKSFAELFQKRSRGAGSRLGPGGPPEAFIKPFIRPFDLSQAPLLRVGLVEIAAEEYFFMVDMHHIISDGTSMGVLVKEFMALYEGEELPRLRLHYKDYAEWETHEQAGITRQEAYWLKEFEDEIPVLDLPLDYLRPKVQGFEGNHLSFEIDSRNTGALKAFALQRGATLYMVLLAVYNIFLAKISGQEIVVVGTPTAGRRHADLEQVIGMFVNTLALKNYPSGEKRFHSFLGEVKEKTLNAFSNQDYQYEELVEKVMTNRDAGRNPLFDTMFVLQNQDIPTIENPGLKLAPYPYERRTSKFDLTLVCIEIDQHLSCSFEYNTTLFRLETIQRFVNYLEKLVSTVPRDPEQQISRIDMLPEEEKKQLIVDFNDTAGDFPKDKTIYRLFEDRVDRFPDSAALVFDDRTVTFGDFDGRANRLANYLRIEKGMQPGDRVAVLMDRSIELIIVLMAVMKARGAYVPLDASLPVQRIRMVINDASIGAAVWQRKYLQKLAGVQAVCIEDAANDFDIPPGERPPAGNAEDPAYVMYTSGSSGIPKGVLVEHRTIVNTLMWRKNNYEYAPGHASLQIPPYFFDSSVTDIFTPLLGGARLVLVRDEERSDLTALRRIITINIVSHFIVVPVFYNVMLEEMGDDLKHIKMICCAGDNFPDELIRKHFERLPHVRIFNEYGPTENSVNSTAYELEPGSPKALIGKPTSNVKVYILDRNLSLCPIGVTGELCLAGSSLAVGYLNRPELTNEKFIIKSFLGSRGDFSKKPLVAEGILYKTGDYGRWLVSGDLEFIGRVDKQVKIRGIRVETGEIENQLLKHDHVKEAVVQVRQDENGNNYLCAYLVGRLALKPGELKDHLSLRLPTYMIPSYFQVLEQLPLTPNGKLDVKALPTPQLKPVEEYTTPRNEIEKKLVDIWKAVLGIEHIGIDDNFFYIGGDSIKSIQIMSRMNRAGYKLEMKDIFQYPVISELAPHVKKLRRLPDQSPVTGSIPLTPIQAAFFNAPPADPHHYNQAVMFYSSTELDKEIIEKIFSKIQGHHDALRMTYKINNETGEVRQINHGPDFPLSLQEYDLRDRENSLEELDKKINGIQKDIHLEKGPLMKLGLFHLDDGDRLLIVIHHLVIDGISWRILFEDIETLYVGYQRGEEPSLPPKTGSFKLWSEKLQEYAHHKNFLKEMPYWTRLESEPVPPIKKDFQVEKNAVKDTRSVSFSLEEAETTLLLNKVNRCYKTEINDILSTALGLGIKKTFGNDRVLIALEGHGREEILQDMDISRTVGWFTTEYPVLLDVSYADDPGRQIKEIKETLRHIPNKGIGFGILKYLTGEENKKGMDFNLKPQIIFNYLGQFDADVSQVSTFKIAGESAGNTKSLRNQRQYELEINGMTANNRLSMTISYNETHFKPQTIAALAGNFHSELEHIIAFCASKETIEPTPSDFTYKGLSIERLHELMETYLDVEDIYTLSPMQEGMLFHALVDESSDSYFEQTAFRLQGELDIGLMEKSLNQLVKRHSVLRTAFVHKDTERPLQVVLKNRPVDFYYRDLGGIGGSEEKENVVREFKAKDKKRSFDLSKDILVRASILRLDKSAYEFTWSFHHILMDGWCIGILNSEFFEIYTGYLENRPYRLPVTKPYRTYIQWLEKQDKEESGRYWQNYLDAFEEQTGIPNKKIDKKENQPGYSNKKVSFQLNGDKTKMLNQLAARHHVTLNIVNQTVWGILLGKYNGKEDVVFGSVVSGRPFELAGVESMVGLFINTIPVRIRFHVKMKFHQLLRKVQQEALAGEPYHYHPLADIQSGSPLKQNLIDHLFIFENYPIAEQIEGYGSEKDKNIPSSLKLTDVDVFEQTNYDFNVLLAGTDRLRITFQYNANVIDGDDVKRMAQRFRLVLNQVTENEELEIEALTLLSQQEKHRLLYEFNDTAAEYPADKTIHRLFEEQVERVPDYAAVVGNHEEHEGHEEVTVLTYGELNKRAGRLARALRVKGIRADSIVGIMVGRSIEMMVGILGILKAGGAYLPMDPGYPEERKQFMLTDSGAGILLTNDFIKGKGGKGDRQIKSLCAVRLAYIIYTSGSTGKPKGVMVKHRSVVNILSSLHREYPLMASDTYLLKTSYIFDVSAAELFGWFLGGGRLAILVQGGEKDPQQILETIAREYITHINFVPSMFELFLEILNQQNIDRLSHLKYIFAAGEALLPGLVKQFRALGTKIILENIYGPTEGTIYACRYSLADWNGKGNIPIGKPLQNIKLYILDKGDHLQPIGITGKLCIAGEGLARGYLNNPELTAERFIFNKSYKSYRTYISKKLYRTGDLARWLPDGNIEFLGRIDHQVKIRGFRIELAEIETRLKTHPGIKEAVVIDGNDRERQYLCAYFTTIDAGLQTTRQEIISLQQLKEYLEGQLPEYMIPGCFVKLDTIPLTVSGKIDRRKLPRPSDADFYGDQAYRAPVTNMQRAIAGIWQEVLAREKVGIRDNFFHLGGNSLDFAAVSNKLRQKLNIEVPVATLFNHPTIEALARCLTVVELPGTSTTVPANFVMLNGSPRSAGNIFLVHEVLGDVGAYMEFCKQLGTDTRFNCWGVEAEKLKNYAPQNVTIEEISAKYIQQVKSVQPYGPYYLATWSWGGHLGLEMALQLEKMGETLSLLAFFDCSGPDYKKNNSLPPFTLETEKDFLRKFFTATGNQAELETINDIQRLWIRAVEVLTGDAALVDELRRLLSENALALPEYDKLTGEELVQYLNLNRIHAYAGARYIPVGKLHTPIHYFRANENPGRVESWKDHCRGPVIYHEINGDHHSIFRNKEQIAEFARLFKELLYKIGGTHHEKML